MITYEQRKMQLAERMAKLWYGEMWDNFKHKEKAVLNYLPLAELSLHDTAEVAMHALSHGYHVKCDEIKGISSNGYGIWIITQGLIPTKS